MRLHSQDVVSLGLVLISFGQVGPTQGKDSLYSFAFLDNIDPACKTRAHRAYERELVHLVIAFENKANNNQHIIKGPIRC